MTEYKKNEEGLLEVIETPEVIPQTFTLAQIKEIISNTQNQKEIKEAELKFINDSLVELDKLLQEANKLGVIEDIKPEEVKLM